MVDERLREGDPVLKILARVRLPIDLLYSLWVEIGLSANQRVVALVEKGAPIEVAFKKEPQFAMEIAHEWIANREGTTPCPPPKKGFRR